jgi:hypothetical protein
MNVEVNIDDLEHAWLLIFNINNKIAPLEDLLYFKSKLSKESWKTCNVEDHKPRLSMILHKYISKIEMKKHVWTPNLRKMWPCIKDTILKLSMNY